MKKKSIDFRLIWGLIQFFSIMKYSKKSLETIENVS